MATILVNNVAHGDARVAMDGIQPGDAANQMLVVPTEFDAAARDHPILFRRDDDGAWQAVVLLGLDRDENLHLAATGWNDSYRPAVQRRGPFVIGMGDDGEPMIRVDPADPRFDAGEGEPLFLPQGGHAPLLERVAEALRTLHIGVMASQPMFAAIEAAGLFRPVALDIEVDENTRYTVADVFAIDGERLAALDGAALAALHEPGFLAPVFAAASSLGNLPRLIALKTARG